MGYRIPKLLDVHRSCVPTWHELFMNEILTARAHGEIDPRNKMHQGEMMEKNISNMIGRRGICPISVLKIYWDREAGGQTLKKGWDTEKHE